MTILHSGQIGGNYQTNCSSRMKSIFTEKEKMPTEEALKKALSNTFELWTALIESTKKANPDLLNEWKYSSEKYGWSFRISEKKRVLIYLLPRDKFFKVAFVFGQKATDEILKSNISEAIVNELKSAKVYAEGRGIRIEVRDKSIIDDIKKLITIKIKN
jgi:hypothetical protein